MALRQLAELKEVIESTESDKQTIMENVDALEELLLGPRKPIVKFSMLKQGDIDKLGIEGKTLVFDSGKLVAAVANMSEHTKDNIRLLKGEILHAYRCYLNRHPIPHTIIIPTLMRLYEIALDAMPELNDVIIPGMPIASSDGIQVKNPMSGYKLTLIGEVNYAVIQFKDEPSYVVGFNEFTHTLDWLLNFAGTMTGELFSQFSDGRLFLIKSIRHSESLTYDEDFDLYMPEAVGQSLAWAKVIGQDEVHFCLSDGPTWVFCVLKPEHGLWTYYTSAPYQITKAALQTSDQPLFEVMHLLLEWLSPSGSQFYELSK